MELVLNLKVLLRVMLFVRLEKFQFLEKGQNHNFDYKIVNFS